MRIGELAALAGVSTRTVRHYHHQGVLPEPSRRRGGYREYGLRDALLLARARRLTELGLSLDEVRDVLTGDSARELRESCWSWTPTAPPTCPASSPPRWPPRCPPPATRSPRRSSPVCPPRRPRSRGGPWRCSPTERRRPSASSASW
ncbi:MerR family transcriptional regulator [Microbispora sp. NPDC049633]|uniref:MerR family transcriptional regulator n=1 Tax=Microbispora sp. NPDC049633 TaxID=3154355 RepID=UPI00341AAE96